MSVSGILKEIQFNVPPLLHCGCERTPARLTLWVPDTTGLEQGWYCSDCLDAIDIDWDGFEEPEFSGRVAG